MYIFILLNYNKHIKTPRPEKSSQKNPVKLAIDQHIPYIVDSWLFNHFTLYSPFLKVENP